MIRQSSIESYRAALGSGLIANCQIAVLEAVYIHHPITANEVLKTVNARNNGGKELTQNTINTRFSELEGMGFIRTKERKLDEVSGKMNTAWTPCDTFSDEQVAVYRAKKKEESKKKKDIISRLESESASLREEVKRLANENARLKGEAPAEAKVAPATSGEVIERYEVFAEGKPGMTLKSKEKANSTDVVSFYCRTHDVPLLQVKFRKLVTYQEGLPVGESHS